MGLVVRAKRVDIFEDVINCSFALDFVDSDTLTSLNGVYKVEGGDVLVGCTEKGRLCVQGSAFDLDWLDGSYSVSFTDSKNRETVVLTLTTEQLIEASIGEEIGSADSDVVGVGRVGYMRLRS